MIHALGFGAVGITGVILAVACVWTGLVAVQCRGYLGSLRSALAGRTVSAERLSLADDESRTMLRQGLASGRPGEVLYCLSLLDGLELPLKPEEVARLLRHEGREVRLEVARRAESGRLRVATTELSAAIAREVDADVKGALLEALAAADEDLVPEVAAHRDAPEERVRLGASAGLIRDGGGGGARRGAAAARGSARAGARTAVLRGDGDGARRVGPFLSAASSRRREDDGHFSKVAILRRSLQ